MILRLLRCMTWPAALLLAAVASGCGTVVYSHTIEVRVSDPSKRLGASPIEVSIFDPQMGGTAEWARKTMAPTSETAPYVVPYTSISAATALDPPRPREFTLALYVPAFETRGAFTLRVRPADSPSGELPFGFLAFSDNLPSSDVPRLTCRYTATPAPKGWKLAVTVLVPPPT